MGKSCKDIAESLVACLKKSECVKTGGSLRDCLATEESCRVLRNAYSQCKREGFNMRNRIRGERVY
jgi:cytochrome c oxidase assembly factor 5